MYITLYIEILNSSIYNCFPQMKCKKNISNKKINLTQSIIYLYFTDRFGETGSIVH